MRDWCGKKWEVPREQGNRQSCPFSGIPDHRVRLFAVSFYVMTKSAAIAFVFKPQIKIYKWPLWRWVNYEFILGLIGINTLAGISFVCLFCFLCSITATTMFLYGSRLFISIADMCGYVYTPEVYPTSMRGIGLGACSGAGRIGCMITPFVAMVSCAM